MTTLNFTEHLIMGGFNYAYGISAADLTGTWSRGSDGVAFHILDDGRVLVAEAMGVGDEYDYYDIRLDWTADDRLEGYAVLKETVSPCRFESMLRWSMEVTSPATLVVTSVIRLVVSDDQGQITAVLGSESKVEKTRATAASLPQLREDAVIGSLEGMYGKVKDRLHGKPVAPAPSPATASTKPLARTR